MKQIILLIFVITLIGNPHQWQIDIASKYDNFIRPNVEIEITNDLICDDCSGYNIIRDNVWGEIVVMKDLKSPFWRSMFENTLIHETVHHIFKVRDENITNKITNNLINYYK